ncbi:MAG: alanine/glycine:cation symporter family protein [Fuerstiella sp.]
MFCKLTPSIFLKPWLFAAALLCCAGPLFATPLHAQDAADGAESEAADSDDSTVTADTPADEVAEKSAEDAQEKTKDWQSKVDDFFGDYLVKPAGAVIFFPLYTQATEQQAENEDGSPKFDKAGKPVMNEVEVPFVVLWLLAGGVFLTLRMGFINLRAFWHAIQLTKGDFDDDEEEGEVTHFQALSAALSATVGLGNIGGVAIAIGTGGPGAALWIMIIGLLGMTTKFAECALGQLYRTTDDSGNTLGGPMRYLKIGLTEKGLGPLGSALSVIFAVLCIGASFGGGNAYQINQSLSAIQNDIPLLDPATGSPWVYGLVMAIAVGVVIIGGIKSIGAVAGKIVPLMCAAYVGTALYILVVNVSLIPSAVSSIFEMAFNPTAAYGGFIGVLVIGIQRAVFSNEAGVGSAAIAHSAAKTNEPVSEGIVALLEPFIDTVVVCSITALVLVITGAYDANRFAELNADNQSNIVAAIEGAAGDEVTAEQVTAAKATLAEQIKGNKGAAMTLVAFRSQGGNLFGYILFAAVILFAFSTCISWSYYGERSWVQLFGVNSSIFYKILFLVFTFLGSVVTATNVLDFSDLMILGMSLPNLLGVFILSGVVKKALDEYMGKLKRGELKPPGKSDS